MPAFLERFFNAPEEKEKRLVGRDKKYDSGYYDIVRFFGSYKTEPSNILIKYLSGLFNFNDPLIAKYSATMEAQLRNEKRLYQGPTVMKLCQFEPDISPPIMTVQEVNYGDVAGCSCTLDFEHPLFENQGGTLRYYYKTKYTSNRIEDNPLANCLGVCGYLLIKEENRCYLLQVTRSEQVASLEKTLGPSVAGGVDFVDGYLDLRELLAASLSVEIKEEMNLDNGEFNIVPLAFAREIFRCERPQLFALIETTLSRKEITTRLNNLKMKFKEMDCFEFLRLFPDGSLDETNCRRLNHEARMNYYLLEEYFQNNYLWKTK